MSLRLAETEESWRSGSSTVFCGHDVPRATIRGTGVLLAARPPSRHDLRGRRGSHLSHVLRCGVAFSNEEEIYQEHILDHYDSPYHRGHCPHPTHVDEGDNPLCGDVVRIELRVDGEGKVEEAWFTGDGCCISQAAASMLVESIEGKPAEEVQRFSAEDMLKLFGVRLTPNRQKCCLLSWRVLQTALAAPAQGGDGDPATHEDSNG